MNYLPTHIIDEIIIRTDFQTAISLHNEYAIKKLYNPKLHTWIWASFNGHLKVIKWFHENNIPFMKMWTRRHGWYMYYPMEYSTKW
jgi:hypothetical protein